jgi:hypothetical protein
MTGFVRYRPHGDRSAMNRRPGGHDRRPAVDRHHLFSAAEFQREWQYREEHACRDRQDPDYAGYPPLEHPRSLRISRTTARIRPD